MIQGQRSVIPDKIPDAVIVVMTDTIGKHPAKDVAYGCLQVLQVIPHHVEETDWPEGSAATRSVRIE